jgi:hypothetical protein
MHSVKALKSLILLALVLILLLPVSVRAQDEPALSVVEVSIWPEFDRPSVLVIYRVTLSPMAGLPAEINLHIPTASGKPNAVAASLMDGSLINLPYTWVESGDWSLLTFTATSPEFQIEYYDPGLQKQGRARHFEYQWLGDYAVESFAVQVQQPLGASDMRISPSLGIGVTATDGLLYYNQTIGALDRGQTFFIVLDYQKVTDALSAGGVSVVPSGPLDNTAEGRMSVTSTLPWMLGAMGVLLIVGGGLWYWQTGLKPSEPQQQRRPRRKPAAQAEEDAQGEHVYCHQCGKRAAAGDVFCRTCGTRLRLG